MLVVRIAALLYPRLRLRRSPFRSCVTSVRRSAAFESQLFRRIPLPDGCAAKLPIYRPDKRIVSLGQHRQAATGTVIECCVDTTSPIARIQVRHPVRARCTIPSSMSCTTAKLVPNSRNRLRTMASKTGLVFVIEPLIEAQIFPPSRSVALALQRARPCAPAPHRTAVHSR